ncbi:hypothetical protein LPJ57_001322 [Coemansia sp. RSA 486]|nr:hypothetical protein LPJ57_001322 [Coemansia sp. RSA 486]KAJ2238159.1 hypothetical protein IWW45_000347 [Coemansia sp. RSA 485]KAJ2601205.1 hypothetical protein GGF39_001376 [Coemansia sp. RSA 1721]
MSKRGIASVNKNASHYDDDDRVDYIIIGTEFLSDNQQRAFDRRQNKTWDGKPKGYSRDAFKGGFTAGYHNTVGSKEGWQPAAGFASSRSSRSEFRQLRPEDFMDEEDLVDLRESQKIAVAESFSKSAVGAAHSQMSGLGDMADSNTDIVGSLAQRVSAEFAALGHLASKTRGIGDEMLRLMGWKPGQGIGPLVRPVHGVSVVNSKENFAKLPPKPTNLVEHKQPKQDKHGVDYGLDSDAMLPNISASGGYEEPGLPALGTLFKPRKDAAAAAKSKPVSKKKSKKRPNPEMMRLSFGTLDDDDEGDDLVCVKRSRDIKETQLDKLARVKANPAISQGHPLSKAQTGLPFCFDGKAPLSGFILVGSGNRDGDKDKSVVRYYSGPQVPEDFTGICVQSQQRSKSSSRWDVGPALHSEAVNSGPKQDNRQASKTRPLQSLFERGDLSDSETYVKEAVQPETKEQRQRAAVVDPVTAKAALSGYNPFGNDSQKQAHYRKYLETCADKDVGEATRQQLVSGLVSEKEAQAFARMAHLYQPNTAMLSRFKSFSSHGNAALDHEPAAEENKSSRMPTKKKQIIRKVQSWAPSQILCKRMKLAPPTNTARTQSKSGNKQSAAPEKDVSTVGVHRRKRASDFIEWNIQSADDDGNRSDSVAAAFLLPANSIDFEEKDQFVSSNPPRPEMELFQSIFGQEAP